MNTPSGTGSNAPTRRYAISTGSSWSRLRGAIMDGEVNHYQVTLKVGFRLEDKDA